MTWKIEPAQRGRFSGINGHTLRHRAIGSTFMVAALAYARCVAA